MSFADMPCCVLSKLQAQCLVGVYRVQKSADLICLCKLGMLDLVGGGNVGRRNLSLGTGTHCDLRQRCLC